MESHEVSIVTPPMQLPVPPKFPTSQTTRSEHAQEGVVCDLENIGGTGDRIGDHDAVCLIN
jgi:hypothetical protein